MNILEKYLGEKVWIEVIDEEGEKVGPTYLSDVINYEGEETIIIGIPRFNKYSIPLPKKTRIRIKFKNMPRERFSLTGIITGKISIENNYGLQVMMYDLQENNTQKRKFFRIDHRVICDYRVQDTDVDKISKECTYSKFTKAISRSISGGGLCLIVKEDIEITSPLEVIVWLEKYESVEAVCEMKSKYKIGNSSKYELNLVFSKISMRDQDAIIKYIFEKEKQMYRKVYA